MKAAIVTAPNTMPVYGEFKVPTATDRGVVVNVTAAALSNLTKMRALGQHYSSTTDFPIVAGTDGVGTLADGTRVYFAMPEAPFGALAEQVLVNAKLTVPVPANVDDVTAAAIANPGMSSWAALVDRAHLEAGQTVLINGATGAAGSLAVTIARHLGAGKVIVSGRNAAKLALLGADEVVCFDMTATDGQRALTKELMPRFQAGVDVVLDYLWGDSALSIMAAAAKAGGAHPTKFVSVGAASGQQEISLPSAALRSSALELLGSGAKSVALADLLQAVAGVFALAADGAVTINTATFALADIETAWQAPMTPRAVVTVN